MLTLDLLKAQDGLTGLTDDQLNSIVGLSERDENAVIARKYGEFRQEIEDIVNTESGIKYNEGEKSSAYLTRALKELRTAADEGAGFKTTNADLVAQITKLKDDIAKGAGNEEIKKELDKLRGELASAKKVNGELQESLTKKEADYKGKLEGYRMESEIGAAMTGIALKKELPEATKQALLTLAKQNVMAAKHVFDETAGMFIFQNEDGTPMQDKSLNNLKVADMLRMQLETMGVLETGRNQGGAGGNGGNGGGGGADVNISSARSKVEADEMMEKQLMAQGHAKSDANWGELMRDLRASVKSFYDTLPLN